MGGIETLMDATFTLGIASALFGMAMSYTPLHAETDIPQKVILDTDIGDDIDDAYALALLATMPEANLLGVTTVYGETDKRAELAAKLLKILRRTDIPVYAGRTGLSHIGRQYEWAKGFKSSAIRRSDAIEFMKREIERAPGEVILIGIGPLINYGDLLTRFPEIRPLIKRIVIMGGSVYKGYDNQDAIAAEWNVRCDPAAAMSVISSGVPLTVVPLDATSMLKFDEERQKRLCTLGLPITDALAALTKLWGNPIPTLYDPMAVAVALGYSFCESKEINLEVDEEGYSRVGCDEPNVTVLLNPNVDQFLDWFIQAIRSE